MRIFLLTIFLFSCGKEDTKCRSQSEMIYRCMAEATAKYYPVELPDWEKNMCERNYPVQGCY